MDDFSALLAEIRRNPDDDLHRKILADWLDEHAAPEWAEFIRLQCETSQGNSERIDELLNEGCGRLLQIEGHPSHWEFSSRPVSNPDFVGVVVRRGFVAEVHCPIGFLLGTRCGGKDCYSRPETWDEDPTLCSECGTQAPAIFVVDLFNHPVERVVPTDAKPGEHEVGDRLQFLWSAGPATLSGAVDVGVLPDDLFNRLRGSPPAKVPNVGGSIRIYATRGEALDDLSTALIANVREWVAG